MTATKAHTNKRFFLGFNTLRFYMAMAVIIFHIGENVSEYSFFYSFIKPFFIDADSAVNFFFVLSGFLITHLLLSESEVKGKIVIGKFYARRAIRILPLYYTILILGLIIFPIFFDPEYSISVFSREGATARAVKIILAFFLLPNFASISAPMVHIWTIGAESQFYILWPWVVQKKKLLQVSVGIVIIKVVLTIVLTFLPIPNALNILHGVRLECMAIGALGAYAYFNKSPMLAWIYHRAIQFLALAGFSYIAIVEMSVNTYAIIGKSIIFIVLILNIGTNPYSLIRFNNPILERLGQLSYGMYLYHFLILYLVLKITPQFLPNETPFYSITVFMSTIGFTWLVSEMSYRWFEKPLLNMKRYF